MQMSAGPGPLLGPRPKFRRRASHNGRGASPVCETKIESKRVARLAFVSRLWTREPPGIARCTSVGASSISGCDRCRPGIPFEGQARANGVSVQIYVSHIPRQAGGLSAWGNKSSTALSRGEICAMPRRVQAQVLIFPAQNCVHRSKSVHHFFECGTEVPPVMSFCAANEIIGWVDTVHDPRCHRCPRPTTIEGEQISIPCPTNPNANRVHPVDRVVRQELNTGLRRAKAVT